MRIVRLRISNFRCVRSAELFPTAQNVLLGPNNTGMDPADRICAVARRWWRDIPSLLARAGLFDGAFVADYDHGQPNRRSSWPWRRDTMSNAIINPLSAAKPPSH